MAKVRIHIFWPEMVQERTVYIRSLHEPFKDEQAAQRVFGHLMQAVIRQTR